MSWREDAKKVAAGKWIKFDSAQPQHILLFTGEPRKVQKESTLPGSKGEVYFQMSFPVEEDGESRILEPNKSLLLQLMAEDEEEDIIGAEFQIKCLNPEKKTSWKIKRLGGGLTAKKQWGGKKEQEEEEANEPKAVPDKDEQDKKAKEKFKADVKKRIRKVKEQEKAEAGDEQHAEAVREPEEAE